MAGSDDEERTEDEETEPGVSRVPLLDISQWNALTKLQKTKITNFEKKRSSRSSRRRKMAVSDNEERIEDEETEPGVSGVPPLDISQRNALTKLQKTKVRILNEFEKNEVDLEKLIILMRTRHPTFC